MSARGARIALLCLFAAGCTKVVVFGITGQFHVTVAFPAGDIEGQTRTFFAAAFADGEAVDCPGLVRDGLGDTATSGTAILAWPSASSQSLPTVPAGSRPAFFVEARDAAGTALARACALADRVVEDKGQVVVALELKGVGPCAASSFCAAEVGVCDGVKVAVLGANKGRLSGEGRARGGCVGENPTGAELVYRFTATTAGRYVFSTGKSEPAGAYLYLRRDCERRGSELSCSGSDRSKGWAALQLSAGETVFAIVDAYEVVAAPALFELDIDRDTSCEVPAALVVGDSTVALTGPDLWHPSCGFGGLSDKLFRFVAPSAGVYSFLTPDNAFSSTVALRRRCADDASEFYCQALNGGGPILASQRMDQGEELFVLVEGRSSLRLSVRRFEPLAAAKSSPLVTIPAGPFLLGSPEGVGEVSEHPQRTITLSEYAIDQHEVTAREYKACADAGQCPPAYASGCQPGDPNDPVLCVGYEEARNYCLQAGKRLPTEAEWEKAARGGCEKRGAAGCEPGVDDVAYPWGNADPDCTRAHFGSCQPSEVVPVGGLPAGDSIYGVHDLAGNAQEFVEDCAGSSYADLAATDPFYRPPHCDFDNHGTRGGGEGWDSNAIRVAARSGGSVGIHYQGVRCAR